MLFSITATAQVKKAFTPRYSETIKGDVTIIANNVLSRHSTNAYNGSNGNHDFSNNVFVDIDSDNSTFNSSSANFSNPEPGLSCLNFKKVLLYWAAADKEYDTNSSTGNGGFEPIWNYNQVKLMLPGESSYNTITADEVIYRGRDEHFVNDPYICVKDITSDVVGLADPFGKFQIANVKATEGDLYSHSGSHTGTSGGWQIVFVYENPSLIGKNVTLFDGYVHITQTEGEVEFDFNGFQTVPTGNVNADIILGSLEGDRDIDGDQLQIFDTNSTWSNLSTTLRDSNNFFNSRITSNNSDYTDRNPASTNTLGFDAGVFDLQNTGNKFIDNNQTSARFKITSDRESYGLYLLGLSVEVYEPSLGALNFTSSTSGTGFNPGDNVQMTLSVENSGNDDIQNLEIFTTLPQEVDFIDTETLPAGVTYNFNTATRELRFYVPDGNTDVGDPLYTLDFNVQIKDQCFFLESACSANFAMQATATFSGVTNTNPVVAQSSGTMDSCGIGNFDPTTVDINQPNQVNWSTASNALDTTVSCDDSDALNAAQLLAPTTEFCSFTLNKVSGSFVVDPSCPSEGTYTNTWTFTDACGRTSDVFTQIITVEDTTAPNFVESLPTDITVECDNVPVAAVLTATDNCDTNLSVTFNEQITDNDSCPSDYVITRTWSVEDCAGHVTEHIQTITVQDNTAPNFVESLPTDTVAAYNAIPNAEVLTANDNCDTSASVNLSETYIGDNTGTTYTIVRTWTASDCSGNAINHVQNIFVTENGDSLGLYINDITVNEDSGNAVLEVFHVGQVTGGFIVGYNTNDGSAIETQDYGQQSSNLNFNGTHGEILTISISINDDNVIEATETFNVQLSPDTNTPTINDNSGEITINDNDGGAANGVSVADFNVDEDAGTAQFTVSLNANVQGGFSVDYDITEGTATEGDDYSVAAATGSIAFTGNAGEQHSITVNITDDALIEDTEQLSIALSGLSTALINIIDANATGTINDNDGGAANGVSVADFNVDEDAGTAQFTVSLNANVQGGFSVDYDITEGTATEGDDYSVAAATGSIAFTGNAGEQHSITVNITDDALIEDTEQLSIALSGLSTALINIIDANATGTINDNDGGAANGVQFDITNIDIDEDTGTVSLPVSLNANVQEAFTVEFHTANGTAQDAFDYTGVPQNTQVLTFGGANSNNQTITFPIIDDIIIEATEDFQVLLSNISTSLVNILSNDTATVNIIDNDGNEGYPLDVTIEACDVIPTAEIITVNSTCATTVDFNESITGQDDGCAMDYTITRTWTFTDCVGNVREHVQVITVIDTQAPTFVETLPIDITVSCDNVPVAAVLTAQDSCDPNIMVLFDEQITDTDSCGSNYIITRTWSASDCAGNPISHTQIITVEDTTAPTFVEALPTDITVSCDNVPVAAVLTAQDNCDPNITVFFDEQITDTDSCGSNYTITRTWSTADCAGNPVSHTQIITVEDTEVPQFVEALPQNMTVMCNEVPDTAVLTAIDNCSTDVTVSFDEVITNDSNCADGYTITRTWSTIDCAGNPNTHTQVITINPTGPIMANSYDEEITLICGDEIPEVSQLTFTGGCGNYQVEFSEETTTLSDTEDFMITRIWDVTDSCGNIASFEQVIFVMQPQPEEIEITICVEDDAINLINYLPASFDTNGVFEVVSGNVTLDGSLFDPANLEVGDYLISYNSLEGTCKYYVDFTISVNSDCVPCGRDEIVVSNTVTANGDNINDLFTITGVEYCNYSFELMIFNRWGDKVYESKDYQNDWGGFAPNNAFGNSGMLPSGTYYYIINVSNTDIEPLNGYIYLGTGAN